MNTIQIPHLWSKLTRNLGIKGRSIAPELAHVVNPVVVLEDHSLANDYEVSFRRSCCGSASFTAGATQFPNVQLFNPLTSNTLMCLDQLMVSGGASEQVFAQLQLGALVNFVTNGAYLDPRVGGIANASAGQIRTASDAVVAGSLAAFYIGRVGSNSSFQVLTADRRIYITPGFGCMVTCATATSTLDASFIWRETALVA